MVVLGAKDTITKQMSLQKGIHWMTTHIIPHHPEYKSPPVDVGTNNAFYRGVTPCLPVLVTVDHLAELAVGPLACIARMRGVAAADLAASSRTLGSGKSAGSCTR